MKIAEEYRRLLREKKIKYDMQNVNGGFSGGVDIEPGQHAGVMNISVNIYGGSQSTAHAYEVPPRIKELQEAFIAARQKGDPVAGELHSELKEYYSNLKRAISLHVVKAMQIFDQQASSSIQAAIQSINAKYQ
jgi:hypothetical protein